MFIMSRNWQDICFLQGITNTSLNRDTVAVLGNMCCILDGSYIENSDPSILENLSNCSDLTSAQVTAVEALLQSGRTQHRYVCPVISALTSSLNRTEFQLDPLCVFPSLELHPHGMARLWRISGCCRSIWPQPSMITLIEWVKHEKGYASHCWFPLILPLSERLCDSRKPSGISRATSWMFWGKRKWANRKENSSRKKLKSP